MSLMTKHGFYSIIQNKAGEFHIRSRVRKDLENLVECVPLSEAKILSTKEADYPFRITCPQRSFPIMTPLGHSRPFPEEYT